MSFSDGDRSEIDRIMDGRLKQTKHENEDHLDRGLHPFKIAPFTAVNTEPGHGAALRYDSDSQLASFSQTAAAPATILRRSADQSVSNGTTATKVLWDVATDDTLGWADTANNEIVVARDAIVFVNIRIMFLQGNGRQTVILRQNTSFLDNDDPTNPGSGQNSVLHLGGFYEVDAGDTLSTEVDQNHGAARFLRKDFSQFSVQIYKYL